MKRKLIPILTVILLFGVIWIIISFNKITNNTADKIEEIVLKPISKKLEVPDEYSKIDKNNNGIADPIDLSNDVKRQLLNKIKYIDKYYTGGYPPETEGVCTDVIWRAFNSININLKELIDNDIALNLSDYPRIDGNVDTNIDFRRVPNMKSYFDKTCSMETTEIIPNDPNNLKNWQPGDILLYLKPYQHVGIVTDERDNDGVPWVIHNASPEMVKSKLNWFSDYEILHYRWNY